MRSKKYLVIICSLMIVGCFDIFKSKQVKLIGNISVIDTNDEDGGRYGLVYYNQKEEYNSNLIEDYVVEVSGNDSSLYVEGIDNKTCEQRFYRIKHIKGKKVLQIQEIDSKAYSDEINQIDSEFSFNTDFPPCP